MKATATVGFARAVEIVVLLVRQKAIAVALAPAGVGVLSVIRNVFDLLITAPLLGLDGSATRFISHYEREGDRPAIRRVVATTLWVAVVVPPLAALVYAVFARRHLESGLEGGVRYLPLLCVLLLSVPFATVASAFNAFLIGFKAVGRTSLLILVSSAFTLCVGVPLIWAYGIWGAVIGLALLQVVGVCAYGWSFTCFMPVVLRDFSFKTMRLMSGVAAANWIGGALALLAFLFVRSRLSVHYSNDVAGLFQSVYALCASYLGPLTHPLIYYTYPRMSELRDREEIVNEINLTLRIVLLLATPAMALMGTAIEPILFVLFSSRFVAAAPLLPFMMVGEWFRLPMRAMGLALLGQERLRPYIFFDLSFYIILIAVTALAGRSLDLQHAGHTMTLAPCVGYAAGAVFATLGYYFTIRRLYGYRLGRHNARLALASLLVLLASLFITPAGRAAYLASAGKLALLALWALYVVRPEEWRGVREAIRGYMSRMPAKTVE